LRLLAPHGTLALVLPIEAETEILHLATQHHLFPTHITHVHTKPGKPAKRLLITLTSSPHHLITSSFHIESDNAPRSEEYIALTKDFYL
jgi:tRNA1Val (adenine37-N6)-methyltransferase